MEPSATNDDAERGLRAGAPSRLRAGLMMLSAILLGVAVLDAFALFILHLVHAPNPFSAWPWTGKTGVALLAIGLAQCCAVGATPMRAISRAIGWITGAGFILWGIEQFTANPALAAQIDDFVVVIFVTDLGLLIRERLNKAR